MHGALLYEWATFTSTFFVSSSKIYLASFGVMIHFFLSLNILTLSPLLYKDTILDILPSYSKLPVHTTAVIIFLLIIKSFISSPSSNFLQYLNWWLTSPKCNMLHHVTVHGGLFLFVSTVFDFPMFLVYMPPFKVTFPKIPYDSLLSYHTTS